MSKEKKKKIQKKRAQKTKENSEIKIGYYVVAVLDILNQKEKLASMNKFPETKKEKLIFEEQLRGTYGDVQRIRSDFNTYIDSFLEAQKTGPLATLAKQSPAVAKSRNLNIKKHYYSDTVVLYCPLAENDYSIALSSIFVIITAIANLQLKLLAQGIVFRGGIDIGIAGNFFENEIYGNALYKAYHLENNIAQYPRVVIGGDLVEYIKSHQTPRGKDFIKNVKINMAEDCAAFIKRDSYDNEYIVDPVCIELQDDAREMFEGMHAKALIFAKNEIERFSSAKNSKLEKRYKALEKLLNS
jgi:hypothetical protein